jgi:hypothetical protein
MVDTAEFVQRLLADGIILEDPSKELMSFQHQLKQDYLAAHHLAPRSDLWTPEAFDAVTFQSASFDSLVMTLEMITDEKDQSKFVRQLYDWNWLGTVVSIGAAAKSTGRAFSAEIQTPVLANVAEKLLDPMAERKEQVRAALLGMPEGVGDRYAGIQSLDELIALVNMVDSEDEEFQKWKALFTRHGDGTLSEDDLRSITASDPILGWTTANVIRRFTLDELGLRQLRAYFETTNRSVRWRVVHALGKFDSSKNVELLVRALDTKDYAWVQFGAVRSLIEIGARTQDSTLRASVIQGLETHRDVLGRRALRRFAGACFDGASSEWLREVEPLVRLVGERLAAITDQETSASVVGRFTKCAEEALGHPSAPTDSKVMS